MTDYDLCVDAYPPGARFEPGTLPELPDLFTASSKELAVAWRRQWQPGQELRVRFLDGDRALHRRVEDHAGAWLASANVGLHFGNHAASEIRVTFSGLGYWSQVGTDALQVAPEAPTMQLGSFTADAEDSVLRRTVLHEFGHALGCIHEQASPAARIPWDEEKVYAFYRDWQHWDRETTYANVLTRYSPDEARFTAHDPSSIMQYPVPATLTRNGFSVGWNNDLSEGDRSFIARMYPSEPAPRSTHRGGPSMAAQKPSAPPAAKPSDPPAAKPSDPPAAKPSALPAPAGASPALSNAVEQFGRTVIERAEASARATTRALERSRRLQVVLYLLMFGVGLGTAVAAVVASLRAESVGQVVAGIGIAGLSAASFFAFFLARPLEALERNAIYTQWLTATVTAYWTRLAYLDDVASVDAEIEDATSDLIRDLAKLARMHAAATSRAAAPASVGDERGGD